MGDKAALAAFVAPRLLEPAGIAAAMASLDERWLLVLHRIAMSDEPVGIQALVPLVYPGKRYYHVDYRTLFRQIADGLLSRGLVLVKDRDSFMYRGGGRFERPAFVLPEVHTGHLPEYPASSSPLTRRLPAGNPWEFCRKVLRAAIGPAVTAEHSQPEEFVRLVAASISFDGGRICAGGKVIVEAASLAAHVVRLWTASREEPGRSADAIAPLVAARHVIRHLPSGHGITVEDLNAALLQLGIEVPEGELARFVAAGCGSGFLTTCGRGNAALFASQPTAGHKDHPFTFTSSDQGVLVDLEKTGVQPLLELASVSQVRIVRSRLHLLPDIALMGRAARRLAAMGSLQQAAKISRAFRDAIKHVESKHGKLLFHHGLVLLKISDLGFRTVVAHELGGRIRILSGPYMAVCPGAMETVEALARKEGLSPRRIQG